MDTRRRWPRWTLVALLGMGASSLSAQSPAPAAPTDPLSRMARLEEQIGALTAELEEEEAQSQRLEIELEGLAGRKQAAKRRLVQRVRTLYRLRRVGYLPLGGGVQELLTHVARVERFERVVAGDVRALRQLRARGDAIRTERARVADGVAGLRDRLRALEVEREGLSDQLLAGRFFSEGFGVFDDGSELAAPYVPGGGVGSSGDLSLPVRTLRSVSDRTYEGGPALGLQAGAGAPVRAVTGGRVGYVGRYADLGRIVIVDHGSDLYGIYGGLAASDVQVSDRVPAGGRLGRLDDTGTLFLQLRRGTRALDARVLLGL